MFNNSNPLGMQRELAGVTRVLSNNTIKTRFVGTGAYATEDTVVVPGMDPDATLSEREQRVIRGYHIHEVSHILHTDNRVWRNTNVDAETRGYWNAMEDVFVERVVAEKYAGARANLQVTVDKVLAGENEEFATEERVPSELPYAVLQRSRKAMGYESPALDEYLAGMPDWLAKEADAYVADALVAASTSDTLKLALEIKKRVDVLEKQQKKKAEGQKQQQGGGEPQQSDEQQQQAQGGGDKQQPSEGGEQQRAPEAQKADDDEPKPEGTSATGGAAKFDLDRAAKAMQRAVEEIAKDHQADNEDWWKRALQPEPVGRKSRAAWRLEANNRYGAERVVAHVKRGAEFYDEIVGNMGKDLRLYAARLGRVLLAQEERYWKGGETEGRIDRRRLAALGTGSRNVFAKQVEQHTDRVAVMVLFDASQSMDAKQSRKALVALNECLGRTNCDLSIMYWHSDGDMLEAKPWGKRHSHEDVRECLANFGDWMGGTVPVKFLYEAAQLMLEHECQRRIVLFCTDGEFGTGDAMAISHIRQQAEALGVEMHGVGIGVKSADWGNFDTAFGRGQWVNADFKRLGESLLGALERRLVAGAVVRAA